MSEKKGSPFRGLDVYLKKVKDVALQAPELAPLAYARAAAHVRNLSLKPENRSRALQLQAIALKLDEFAAEATVMPVDPVDGEQIAVYSDDPSGKLPTEWDGVLADHEAAHTTDEGRPTDGLEHAALFARFQKDRLRDISHPVNVVPESVTNAGNLLSSTVLVRHGGSSGSGSFTGTGGVAGAVVAAQETSIIRWDGRDGEEVPCRVAISPQEGGVNATYPSGSDGTNTYSYRPFARVKWGTGDRGAANEVLLDIRKGTQFTINASRLYVNVGMDSFTASTSGFAVPVTYVAGAMYVTGNLGFFAGASTQVTRTRYIDETTVGSSTTIPVPAFATSLLPPQSTVTGASGETRIRFQDANGNNLYVVQFINGTIVTPIPISNDCYQIQVTNVAGATAAYRLIFELSL